MAMTPRQIRTREFLRDFKALLEKYNTNISAKDEYNGYPECGEDIQISIDADAIYDEKTGDTIEPWFDISLGCYISPENLKKLINDYRD